MKLEIFVLLSILIYSVISLSGCIGGVIEDASTCCVSGFIILIVLLLTYAFLRGGNLRKPSKVVQTVESRDWYHEKFRERKKICPQCEKANPEEAVYCQDCGMSFKKYQLQSAGSSDEVNNSNINKDMNNADELHKDPLIILKLRYSKGEITKEEYQSMKNDLLDDIEQKDSVEQSEDGANKELEEAKKLFEKAYDFQYEKRDFEKAIDEYRNLIELYPDSDIAKDAKLQIENIENEQLRIKQDLKKAKDLYDKAYGLHYREENSKEAFDLYQKIVDLYPESEQAEYAKSQIANIEKEKKRLKKEQSVKAKELYDEASNLQKKQADLDKALEKYQTIIDSYPFSEYVKDAELQIKNIEQRLLRQKESESNICKVCGSELEEKSNFCPFCGTKQEEN